MSSVMGDQWDGLFGQEQVSSAADDNLEEQLLAALAEEKEAELPLSTPAAVTPSAAPFKGLALPKMSQVTATPPPPPPPASPTPAPAREDSAVVVADIQQQLQPKYEYTCRYCGKVVKKIEGLRKHMNATHQVFDPEKVTKVCPRSGCGRQFANFSDFDKHTKQDKCFFKGGVSAKERACWVPEARHPKTQQELADTFGFQKYGEMSPQYRRRL